MRAFLGKAHGLYEELPHWQSLFASDNPELVGKAALRRPLLQLVRLQVCF